MANKGLNINSFMSSWVFNITIYVNIYQSQNLPKYGLTLWYLQLLSFEISEIYDNNAGVTIFEVFDKTTKLKLVSSSKFKYSQMPV